MLNLPAGCRFRVYWYLLTVLGTCLKSPFLLPFAEMASCPLKIPAPFVLCRITARKWLPTQRLQFLAPSHPGGAASPALSSGMWTEDMCAPSDLRWVRKEVASSNIFSPIWWLHKDTRKILEGVTIAELPSNWSLNDCMKHDPPLSLIGKIWL